jgi:hypothetical protein
MFGVIIWSDPEIKNAVIWCEDQGDLAFFQASTEPMAEWYKFPDAGDYVAFDVELHNDMRVVRNPRPVQAGLCEELPSALLSTARCLQKAHAAGSVETGADNVTNFDTARRERKRRAVFTEILVKRLG